MLHTPESAAQPVRSIAEGDLVVSAGAVHIKSRQHPRAYSRWLGAFRLNLYCSIPLQVVYEGYDNMKAVRVAASGNYNNKYGTFPHKVRRERNACCAVLICRWPAHATGCWLCLCLCLYVGQRWCPGNASS